MALMINKRILAIIPARGGSKGLPRKNILNLAGKPLIAWTIEASLMSKYITKTVVSSDDDEILAISKRYGADTLKRSDELATDIATSESVISNVINELKLDKKEFDYIVLLQPTSPLRDYVDIDLAFSTLFGSAASALISVCEIDNKILKAFKSNQNGFIEGISNNKYPFMRRQDLPKTYMSNGAIYIIDVDAFLNENCLFTNNCVPFEMGVVKSLDVDTREDLSKAERYIL